MQKCISRAASIAAAILLSAPIIARADYHLFYPNEMDYHEVEIEHNGSASLDHRPGPDGARSYTMEIGTGVTQWWHPEIELGIERDGGPDAQTRVREMVLENTVRLTEPGEYWLDLSVFGEYAHALVDQTADTVKFGPLLQKTVGYTTHTLNLFLEKQLGANQDAHGLDFTYAWQSRWNWYRQFSPAFEIYGDVGQLDHAEKFARQQFLAGPVVLGQFFVGAFGKFKYEIGYLFGATEATAHGTVRWKTELEIPF